MREINNYLSGKECHILGSGESLKGFDFTGIDDKFTIAINHTIEHYKASALIFNDRMFLRTTSFNLENYHGLIFCSTSAMIYQPIHNMLGQKNVYIYTKNEKQVSYRFEDGLFHPCSTGWLALNLALIMNAEKIYLYGFDFTGMHFFESKEHHIYQYKKSNIEDKAVIEKCFEPWAWKIINKSKISKLSVFEKDEN